MITRTHIKGDAPSVATYSDCEAYRYSLNRVWNAAEKSVLFVMLNPSTATEVQMTPRSNAASGEHAHLGLAGLP